MLAKPGSPVAAIAARGVLLFFLIVALLVLAVSHQNPR
jgi:hypothetical protein